MFWSGVHPRQFSHLENFRALTDPGGICRKGIIIQRRQLPSGLLVIEQSYLIRKGDVPGASIHVPINSIVHTDIC